jgi:hypothetical protein
MKLKKSKKYVCFKEYGINKKFKIYVNKVYLKKLFFFFFNIINLISLNIFLTLFIYLYFIYLLKTC